MPESQLSTADAVRTDTGRRPTCPQCGRPQRTCLCDLVVPVDNRVEVLILQDPLETHQAKGSAWLLHRSLLHSQLSTGTVFDETVLQGWLHADGRQPWLLYPETQAGLAPHRAQPVDNMTCPQPAHLRLVVIDATWRKSLRLLMAHPVLQSLPRWSLPSTGLQSRYPQLRRAPRQGQLSTLEACCTALAQLEGEGDRYAPLLRAFEGFITRMNDWRGGRGAVTAGRKPVDNFVDNRVTPKESP